MKDKIQAKINQLKSDLDTLKAQAIDMQREISQRQDNIKRIELTSLKLSGALEAYESCLQELPVTSSDTSKVSKDLTSTLNEAKDVVTEEDIPTFKKPERAKVGPGSGKGLR